MLTTERQLWSMACSSRAEPFRANQTVNERVMDSNAIERERGINYPRQDTSVMYKDVKINIIDTPGHADFGGEVERILKMVDGVILLVDAAEGPMPQTRFVLQHALELGHRVIIVINKIDRPDARIKEVIDECYELLMDLDASDEQLDSPILFCSGRDGTASLSEDVPGTDLVPLFDKILEYIPAPEGEPDEPLQLLVFIDRLQRVCRKNSHRKDRARLHQGKSGGHNRRLSPFQEGIPRQDSDPLSIAGLNRVPVDTATVGDIVCISGIESISIGDTICDVNAYEPLPFVKISEPTVEMTFSVNDSPFAGREGKFVTSRHIRDRLFKELLKDVSLRVTETDSTDSFKVAGRGEMHLSILIENMRREGYELGVSTPRVLYKEIDGKLCEPIEELVVDVPEGSVGAVIEKMGSRKAEMISMTPVGSRMRVVFHVPGKRDFSATGTNS